MSPLKKEQSDPNERNIVLISLGRMTHGAAKKSHLCIYEDSPFVRHHSRKWPFVSINHCACHILMLLLGTVIDPEGECILDQCEERLVKCHLNVIIWSSGQYGALFWMMSVCVVGLRRCMPVHKIRI